MRSATGTDVKFFEVRDSMTCIPVMVTSVCADQIPTEVNPFAEEDRWFIRRSGWGQSQVGLYFTALDSDKKCTALGIAGNHVIHSYHNTSPARTLREAFTFIQREWFNLDSGEVIDVEFILGETQTKKTSDRLQSWGPR